MFKNHSIQIKLVKTPKTDINDDATPVAPVDYSKIEEIAEKTIKRVVVGTVVVVASSVVLGTLGQIAVNALNPANKN